MSVFNLILSPAAKGLFSAAISQSGSPLSPFVGLDKHPRYYALKLIEELGGNPDGPVEEQLKLLQATDATKLLNLTNMFEEFIRAPMPFKPIVDKDLVDDPVLPDEPINLIQTGQYNKVPLITGTNQHEGLLIKGFYERIPEDEHTEEESKICVDYRNKLFGKTRFGSTGKGSDMLVQLYGDLMFAAPADAVCKMMAEEDENVPIYQYIYNHQGYFSLYDAITCKPWQLAVKGLAMLAGLTSFKSSEGVCHGDELFIMFKGQILPDIARTEQDKRVR